jgi:NADH:ubiquinone oxidoreductase subunit E
MKAEDQTLMQAFEAVLQRYPAGRREHLIPILQELQQAHGYLTQEAILAVGAHVGLPANKVYGVAMFYRQFRFHPAGRYQIRVCRGTSCHVNRSVAVLGAVQRALGIRPGQTTSDGLFSLEVVPCLGSCGHAPVMAVNHDLHGGVTPGMAVRVLAACRRRSR